MNIVNQSAEKKSPPLFLSDSEKLLGAALLHHQCLCWGRDICYPAGNLLIERGFVRHGVPENETGANSYRLAFETNREIVLWGFGAFCGESNTGGAFFARNRFSPTLLPTAALQLPLWKLDQLPPEKVPQSAAEISRALHLTAEFLRFLIVYEKWITETRGGNWRRNCLRSWEDTCFSPTEMSAGWRRLLKNCAVKRIIYQPAVVQTA